MCGPFDLARCLLIEGLELFDRWPGQGESDSDKGARLNGEKQKESCRLTKWP